LEQYRDSILPARGQVRADGWYLIQARGFALRKIVAWVALLAAASVARFQAVRVPAGSVAGGRLTRVERYPERVVVGVRFQDLDWPGFLAHLRLKFDRAPGLASIRDERRLVLSTGVKDDEAVVMMKSSQPILRRGTLMFWKTAQ
jgi:hypothetical protein